MTLVPYYDPDVVRCAPQERDLGYTIPVQCFNAGAIAAAALGTTALDLLTISTQGGELEILDSIPSSVEIRVSSMVSHLLH